MSTLVNLDEVDRQIAAQSELVDSIAGDLAIARRRLTALASLRDSALELDDEADADDDRERNFDVVTAGGTLIWSAVRSGGKGKRTPSTQMLANLVVGSHRPWTREQLHAAYAEKYGIPETWKSPANALNNAIGRAADQGLILRMMDGRFIEPDDVRASTMELLTRSSDGTT